MTQAELSERLRTLGRAIPTASIGRMESGDRRIDVDDLMAISYALDVSPLSLLLPFTDAPADEIQPAGVGRQMDALAAWQWATGSSPHHFDSGNRDHQVAAWRGFRDRSHPWWLRVDVDLDERILGLDKRIPPVPADVSRRADPLYDARGDDGEYQATS